MTAPESTSGACSGPTSTVAKRSSSSACFSYTSASRPCVIIYMTLGIARLGDAPSRNLSPGLEEVHRDVTHRRTRYGGSAGPLRGPFPGRLAADEVESVPSIDGCDAKDQSPTLRDGACRCQCPTGEFGRRRPNGAPGLRVRPNPPVLPKLFRTSSQAVDPSGHCHW